MQWVLFIFAHLADCFGKWFSPGVNSPACEISSSRRTVADEGLISVAASCCCWGCRFQVNLKHLALRKSTLENRPPLWNGWMGPSPHAPQQTNTVGTELAGTHSPIPTPRRWSSLICISFLTASTPTLSHLSPCSGERWLGQEGKVFPCVYTTSP